MPAKPIIVIDDLSFSYAEGGFALQGINAEFGSGINVLTGPNGSGKSTLCRLIIGLLQPASGRIFINGRDASSMSLGERGREIGYLYQNPALQLFAPEIYEELSFIPRLLGMNEADIIARRDELLQYFGLDRLGNAPVFHLSRGEKQRLALCGILFMRPAFLILDEPTTGLDEDNRSRLAALLQQLAADGVGILLISHDEPFIELLEEKRLFTMEKGVLNRDRR